MKSQYESGSLVLFIYNTSSLTKTQRVKFFYALNGRNKPGMLDNVNAQHFGIATVLVPSEYEKRFQDFLHSWHISFQKIELHPFAKPTIGEYKPMALFSYSTSHLLKKDKIRFYYALKGRDGKSGMVQYTNARHLGKAILLVKQEFEKEIDQFLHYWKCHFTIKRVWVKS